MPSCPTGAHEVWQTTVSRFMILFGHLHLDGMAGGWREVEQICLVLGFAHNFLEPAIPCFRDLWLSPAVSLP